MSIGPLVSLQDRVTALEQAIAALQGSEALQPNYLTIDPATGQVSATFSGLIKALGLILPSSTDFNTATADSEIQWQRVSDGALVAQIWAGDDGAGHTWGDINFIQEATDLSGSQVQLRLSNATDGSTSGISVNGQDDSLLGSVSAFAQGSGGSQSANILLSDGRSDFIFNKGPNIPLALNCGGSSVTGNGTTIVNVSVPHNIGRVPRFACVVPEGWAGYCDYNNGSSTGTTADLSLTNPAGFTNGQPFFYSWVAIG